MAINAGSLMVKFSGMGITKVTKQLEGFRTKFQQLTSKMKPALDSLTKGFGKFGLIALTALWKLQQASPKLGAQMDIMNRKVNSLLRVFGDELAPVFETINDALSKLIEWFKGLSPELQKSIAIAGAVTIGIGLLAGAFIALNVAMSPITLLVIGIGVAIGALYYAWTTNLGGIQEKTQAVIQIVQPILELIGNLINSLIGIIGDIIPIVTNVYETVKPLIEALWAVFESSLGLIIAQINIFVTAISGIVDVMKALLSGDLSGVIDGIGKLFTDMIDAVLKYFDKIFDWFGSIGTFILEFIDLWIDAGKAIGQAFVDGLMAIIQPVLDLLYDALDFLLGLVGIDLDDLTGGKEVLLEGTNVSGATPSGGLVTPSGGWGSGQGGHGVGLISPKSIGESSEFPTIGIPIGTIPEGYSQQVINYYISNVNITLELETIEESESFLESLDSEIRQATLSS